jgi:hypothetical protein
MRELIAASRRVARPGSALPSHNEQQARGQRHGDRDDPTGGAADVGLEAHELHERVDERERDRHDRAQQGEARLRIAERWHRRGVEGNAGGRHELSLAPATTTEEQEYQLRIDLAERLRDREQRADVPARPASDEEHAARTLTPARPVVQR